MFLDEMIKVRISGEALTKISKIVERDSGERFDNMSHFIRCSIFEKIRKEDEN